jgi:2-polyprenyl-3-methyl-5-hydroxy-6-metoxy-1,4-benzoquinol methylase
MLSANYERKACDFLRGGLILEVGCGEGRVATHLVRKGCRLVAVDIVRQQEAIEAARHEGFDFLVANGENLPIKNKLFDAVITLQVIEHVDSPMRFLLEIHRVMRDGGYLVISTVNAFNLTNLLRHFLRRTPNIEKYKSGHYYIWDLHHFTMLLSRTGFSYLHHKWADFNILAGKKPGWISFVDRLLGKVTYRMVVHAKKMDS